MTKLSFYQRFARPILWLTLFVLPFGIFGAVKAVQTTKNQIIDWLPANFEETQRLFWFADRFVSDEILAISWTNCTLDNEAVDEFVAALQAPYPFEQLAPELGPDRPIFHEVMSGRSVFAEMTSEPLNLLPDHARERMQGWLLGKDKNTTCVVARISRNPDHSFSRDEAVAFARETAQSMATGLNIAPGEIKIAGPTADSAAINRAGNENINLMRLAAVGLGLGLAWLGLRNLLQVSNVFSTAMLATWLSLASVYFCGEHMDAILLPLPALVFVLTISGAVHLTHYYRDAQREHGHDAAPGLAIQAGGIPCALAAITTMIGLASLSVSNVMPVRRFGLLSALGVGMGLVCLLVVWPALTQIFATADTSPDKSPRESKNQPTWWLPLFALSIRARWAIVLLAAFGLPLLCVGVTRINTSVNLTSLLPPQSDLLQSYEWFHNHIGPLVPIEVVLQFPTDSQDDARTTFRRAELVESLRTRIAQLEQTGGTFAATMFAPELPTESGARQILMQRVVGQKLLNRRPLFVERGLIAMDGTEELWRVSTRVSSPTRDYEPFLQSLNTVVNDFVAEENASPTTTHLAAKICGSIPLIQKAQQQLLIDLIRSLMVAVGLIAVAMVLLLRGFMPGLISMVPNVFPSLLVLGVMGFCGKLVDIGTMMTASVALGIAVDDTLHFLVWFRRAALDGSDRITAIRKAYEKCAGAMLQTSIICGFGMLPFVFSSFGPVSRFAGGMVALLAAALIGDLLVLPAILASPLGKLFVDAPLGLPAETSSSNATTTNSTPLNPARS